MPSCFPWGSITSSTIVACISSGTDLSLYAVFPSLHHHRPLFHKQAVAPWWLFTSSLCVQKCCVLSSEIEYCAYSVKEFTRFGKYNYSTEKQHYQFWSFEDRAKAFDKNCKFFFYQTLSERISVILDFTLASGIAAVISLQLSPHQWVT